MLFRSGFGAKDGGRINKDGGGGLSDVQSMGLENEWYGFDPRRINEEKMRQWISRQGVDDATKDQLSDRGWLNPDETYDPYKSDEIDYGKDDGGPVLMNRGGRTGYKGGGGPFDKSVPFISGDTVPFIDKLQLASPPAPHIPHPHKPSPMSLEGGGGGGGLGDIGNLISNVTKNLGKGPKPAAAETVDKPEEATANPTEALTASPVETPNIAPEGNEAETSYRYGGRAKKAGGGGFADWLAGLKGGNASSAGVSGYAPYMQKAPSYYSGYTQNMETQPSSTISNLGNLYKNIFNREADPAGLSYWQQQQKAGMSLGDIANYFTHSPRSEEHTSELQSH